MNKQLTFLFLALLPLLATSQTPTQTENYVHTKTYKAPTSTPLPNPAASQAFQNVAYYDGLGRPKQTVAHKQGGDGEDLVTHIEYDEFGRQVKEYLPYPRSSASLGIDNGALSGTESFYDDPTYGNTQNPFSEKELETSPLNRVLKQAAPGNTWAMGNGHEIEFDYQANTANEVYLFGVNSPNGTPALVYDGYYGANELYKTVTRDENHTSGSDHSTEEFTDKQGRVLLKRTYDNDAEHDTYYIYDDYGNLTFVFSPKLSKQIVSGGSLAANHDQLMDALGYRYKYDHRNRLIQKKLPGKTREYIAYDPLDRPVATGPVHNPFHNGSGQGWLITKYDAFGRVAYTLWKSGRFDENTRQEIQNSLSPDDLSVSPVPRPVDIDGIPVYYTNNVQPTAGKLLTVNYYDDYRFEWAPGTFPSAVLGQTVAYDDQNTPKGMPTGSWARILEGTSNTSAIRSYILYDLKGRGIRAWANNHADGFDRVDSKYNFIGDITQTVTAHRAFGQAQITLRETFEHNAQGRLASHRHRVNSEPEQQLADNEYDPLGQLKLKEVGGLQEVDYRYNVRGWLTDINDINKLGDDLFAFAIDYGGLYNGNISGTAWRTANDNQLRQYGYRYDALNRLTDAVYGSNLGRDSYNEHLKYDENGNILGLIRNGEIESASLVETIDKLEYTYDMGNQLESVKDATSHPAGFKDGNTSGDDYAYDNLGNLSFDRNKEIERILYNHLNLPKLIKFESGESIYYLYSADGTKLRKRVDAEEGGGDTDYLSSFIYENQKLKFIHHAEGYVEPYKEEGFRYVYNYSDILGNVRLSYADLNGNGQIDGNGEILDEKNYYPFGGTHSGYNTQVQGTYHPYGYNGKEENNDLDLNTLDFGARNYDPWIGRWMNIDPLAEDMRRHSPYNYAFNNPISFIDPDGMAPFWINNGDGTWTAEAGDSAYTLAQDAGISMEEANNVVESQLGENYTRESDGMLMSDVEVGDVVNIDTPTVDSDESSVATTETTQDNSTATEFDVVEGMNQFLTYISPITTILGEAVKSGVNVHGEALSASEVAGAKWLGRSLGVASLGINAYQYNEAVKNNDQLGQEKAKLEATANGLMMYGGPIGWGVGGGVHLSLILNPSMKPAVYKPDWTKTCFVAGTKILLNDGTSKNIEDIKVGDEILSVNMNTMEVEADQVLIVPDKDEKYNKIYMEYDNGYVNIASAHHPFFVKGKGWSVYDVELAKKDLTFEINQIELGDTVYYYDDGILKETKIIKMEDQKEEALMYNIKYVKKNNTFFANGILVHNRYIN